MDSNLENNKELEKTSLVTRENDNENMDSLENNLNIINEIETSDKDNASKSLEDVVYTKPKKSHGLLIFFIILLILAIIGAGTYYFYFKDRKKSADVTIDSNKYLAYKLLSNGLEEFDLYFLKLNNTKLNKLYSPLSIKYAMEMLSLGASGNTKTQIDNIIGSYKANKYTNSSNMSFANALFVKDSDKSKYEVKLDYINGLKDSFNADVIYADFKTPDMVNSWVSERTFNLVNNLVSDISNKDFILLNALAIDMEWVNKIQPTLGWYIGFNHENYYKGVGMFSARGYTDIEFEGLDHTVDASHLAAVANRYDIVATLGEDNIRTTITNEYNAWKEEHAGEPYYEFEDTELFVNKFIEELKENYNKIGSSTDFSFYDDESVRVFAKDLKEYDGMTLEYIGIMPKVDNLDTFISNMNSTSINELLGKLKNIEPSSFKDGVVTEIDADIPVFKFEYELNLIDNLKELGITDVFDAEKANLSNINKKAYVSEALHKANIEFSNDGIKAAAATFVGGGGGGDYRFEHLYEVPVEKIDLTFNKPFMFIIRDKSTSEVWFAGTVYEPLEDGGNFNLGSGR